jgi:hypothetical protein
MKNRIHEQEQKAVEEASRESVQLGMVAVSQQTESTINTRKEIAEECVEEASLIRSEIERLKTQRATLRDMIEYVEVVAVYVFEV